MQHEWLLHNTATSSVWLGLAEQPGHQNLCHPVYGTRELTVLLEHVVETVTQKAYRLHYMLQAALIVAMNAHCVFTDMYHCC